MATPIPFKIPLVNIPQTFDINLGGVNYSLTCKWNPSDNGGWVLDLVNADTNLPVAANIPLITGADCLAGLEYLEIGGELLVYTDGDQDAVPTLANLGIESNLYFVTSVAGV